MPASVQSSEDGSLGSGSEPEASTQRASSLAIRSSSKGKRKRTHTMGDEARGGGRKAQSRAPDGSDESEEENEKGEHFDPDQPLEERREIQRGLRELQKELAEKGDEFMQPTSTGLQKTLEKAQALSDKVKQTNEAATESRLLISIVDMSYRKTLQLVKGANANGIDVDEFVSKCATYMKRGGGIPDDDEPGLSSTQRHRRATGGGHDDDDDDDDDEDGVAGDEMLNWAHLGRFASTPIIRRPALTGFLLGPLSAEKKARKTTKRVAKLRRDELAEVRPEVLNVNDLSKKENDVAAICSKIFKQLKDVQERVQSELGELFEENEYSADEANDIMHARGLRTTGGIDLMRFVVNPSSFGQTVENIFYTSFLIRDGKVKIEFDEFDMPSLSPLSTGDDEEEVEKTEEPSKHQAILSIDMQTWRDIIETFGIVEPMIEHRQEQQHNGPGARGWYS